MLRVGLTGGVGSGKSTVAAMLQELGAHISASDEIGRAMMQPGEPVFRQIVAHFGQEVVRPDGQLDRATLARLAFQGGRIEELNRIVHPAVIRAQQAWLNGIARQFPAAVAVVESALLFETRRGPDGEADAATTPWRTRFDRIVVVLADRKLRLDRYLQRESASAQVRGRAAVEEDARGRMAAQLPDHEKAALADYVLHNNGTEPELQVQVEQLYRTLQAQAADQSEEAM